MQEILSILNVKFILLVFLGSLAGLLVGALPGLSVTMATALLVSLSFSWSPVYAMALIMGVYTVGVYAGAITAILINIPGAPSSIATSLDGYPMAQKGQGILALKTASYYSFMGAVIGFIVLAISAKPMTKLALAFGPIDYFLLAFFGLTTVGSLTTKDFSKGLLSALLGIFFSLIGMDPITGAARFTYGSLNLHKGIGVVPVLIGLFGLSEILFQLSIDQGEAKLVKLDQEKTSNREIFSHWFLGIRSSIIGVLIGALPGTGGPIAALLAYEHAKGTEKNPKVEFGQGAIEGIVASEAANNACIGGALIPMLSLAIPGDAVTAVILSAFYVHGLRPGPLLFRESPQMFYVILLAGLIGSLMILFLGLVVAPFLSKLVTIDKSHLFPIVLLLSVLGAYASSSSIFDVFLMFIFGLLGFIMRKRDYPIAPMILGLVLGGMMDSNFRRAMSLLQASDNPLMDLFSKPITVILAILLVFSLVRNFLPPKSESRI